MTKNIKIEAVNVAVKTRREEYYLVTLNHDADGYASVIADERLYSQVSYTIEMDGDIPVECIEDVKYSPLLQRIVEDTDPHRIDPDLLKDTGLFTNMDHRSMWSLMSQTSVNSLAKTIGRYADAKPTPTRQRN